jgi:hypothetical protein|tara:strand:+ start:157 stop:567 length:411 start_codon:yes stop_codon:yes gene_type:complete
MGFKLGTERGNYAVSGEIKTKMRFHQEAGGDASVPGTPVIRKNLEPGVLGEANMDGSIYLSNTVQPNSHEENQVLLHEMRHATDLKIGKLVYDDNFIKHNGVTYLRETRDGKDMIKIDGKWKEAGEDFPWEKEANI